MVVAAERKEFHKVSFPGPIIRVHKGDTAFVTVHNQGKYGVTIHWLLLPV